MGEVKVPFDNRRLIDPEVAGDMIRRAKNIPDQAIIAFYYIFGTRVSEPFYMKKDDIWLDEDWFCVKIRREKTKGILPKIDTLKVKTDTVFLHYLIAHWSSLNDGDRVWDFGNNTNTFRNYVWRLMKRLNADVWPHLFRHSRNEYLRRKGFTTAQRMSWFGWIDPSTADKSYSHPPEKEIEQMGDSIE